MEEIIDEYSSNSNDVESREEPHQPRRSGRTRPSAEDDASNSSNGNARNSGEREMRRLRPKNNQSTSLFMDNFDPDTSQREKRKQMKKNGGGGGGGGGKSKGLALYDTKGLLLPDRLDLCDCMSPSCEGCHFPCHRCKSAKCAAECRQSRRWQYETVELDGVADSARKNPNLIAKINRNVPDKT